MSGRARYWMFVDEFGTVGKSTGGRLTDRFLSLTGVIVSDEENDRFLIPELETFKDGYFGRRMDGSPHVLHRVDLLNCRPPFRAMADPLRRPSIERDLVYFLARLKCSVVTVAIDKNNYLKRNNGEWRAHPYHLSMEFLIERFIMFLNDVQGQGRIVVESRGKREDDYLTRAMEYFYEHGNTFFSNARTRAALPDGCISVSPKDKNIGGLQVADLYSLPSFYVMHAARFRSVPLHGLLKDIIDVLEDGKIRTHQGRVDGIGRKWVA